MYVQFVTVVIVLSNNCLPYEGPGHKNFVKPSLEAVSPSDIFRLMANGQPVVQRGQR